MRFSIAMQANTPRGIGPEAPMAAPELNRAHQQDIRVKIKTTQLVNRLQAFALGEKAPNATEGDERMVELDAARLKAIEILLRKSLPDLSAVTHQGDDASPIRHVIERRIVSRNAGD